MERPAKRPRLLTPLDSVYNAGFANRQAYYETPDDELNDYGELEEAEDEPVSDPDQELERKRAEVDFKLKATFETIFEKYGKDFEGIGDEIDMRTGEILVNNGHILEMRHEMDAGDSERRRNGPRTWSEEGIDDMSGSEEEEDDNDVMEDEDEDEDQEDDDDGLEEEDEEDSDDEDALSDGDMMEEDDMILRGFAQASQQFMRRQRPQNPGPSRDRFTVHAEAQHPAASRPSLPGSVLPSRSEILAQFGPQLGPKIVKYVSKRGTLEDGNIEPAWWVPDIVPTALPPPIRRPSIKSMVRRPELEPERSPSPENAPSIWAVAVSKSGRKRFLKDDDDMLLDFVADARKQGLNLSSNLTWRQLEAMDPRHDWNAWKSRYMRKFTYLQSGLLDESDLSTSETSANTNQIHDKHLGFRLSVTNPGPPRPSRPIESQRPTRVRKPAQRDGIVSWSEAVATIASVDPVGNAGLLDDVRRTIGYSFEFDRPVSSPSAVFPTLRHSQDEQISKQPTSQYAHHRYPPGPGMRVDSLRDAEEELALKDSAVDSERDTIGKAPCPHPDCTPYPTILYKLERRYDEDLSPMCSHLLRVHRIAPLPCGELNCERKGTRGYFMQKDLVRHVEEVHPYIAAFQRLRGRVDPGLLDQTNSFERLYDSIENRRPGISGLQQPRDSDFMAPKRPFSSHGFSSGPRVSLSSDQDPDRILTLQAGARAVSDGVSSMLVLPSSVTVKDMPSRINSRENCSDSDVQMLDEGAFLTSRTSKTEVASYPNLTPETAAVEKSVPRPQGVARNSFPRAQEPKIQCNYPGCGKMISTHGGNMLKHLRVHERHSRLSTVPKESNSTSKIPLPAFVPNSQSSADAVQSSGPAMSTNGESSQFLKPPNAIKESFVDRSYEFSDEEEGIRPVFRRPPVQPVQPEKRPSIPQSFFAPSPKAKPPQSATPPNPPPALPKKSSFAKSQQSFTTPIAKIGPRKSIVRDVLDSEDFDELSLCEDGFILLSARPRSTALPKSAFHVRVKQEQPENQSASATSTRKRRFSTLRADEHDEIDEIDELAEDGGTMSTPYQPSAISSSKPRPKKGTGERGLPSIRPATKSTSRKVPSHGSNSQPSSSIQAVLVPFPTPTKEQQLPAKTNTPLVDLVKRGQPQRNEPNGSSEEIPSTSELGSSPNSHRARTRGQREAAGTSSPLTALVTPRKNTWAGRTVKQEDEVDSIVTPGGTLRSCGQDGFVCVRPFCFKCRSVDGNVAQEL